MDELVQLSGSESDSDDNLVWVNRLKPAVDDTRFDQRNSAVGQDFRMHTEIFPVGQVRKYGVRQAAKANLNRAAILDQTGDVPCDQSLGFTTLVWLEFGYRLRMLAEGVDFADMHLRVAAGARHLAIGLGNDVFGAARRRQSRFHARAHADVAVAIGRGDLDQRHVNGKPA